MDDITVELTTDGQAPFLALRKRLDQLNRHLIRELFPRQPQPPPPASESDEPTRAQPEAAAPNF
jgi:hypothetical protein